MIYILDLNEKELAELLPFFKEFLPPENFKILNSAKPQKALISLAAKLFIRLYVADKYGIPLDKITFFYTENQKPYLKEPEGFYFNISHSENKAAVAISDCEIGVDLEKIRKFDKKTCERFFSREDLNYITSENCDIRFTEIWTRKEAFIKLHALNLSHLKTAETENIFTLLTDDFILSYCDHKGNEHKTEKIYLADILKLLEKVKNI